MTKQRRTPAIIDGEFTVKRHEMVVKKNEVSTEVKKNKWSNMKSALVYGGVGLALFGTTVGINSHLNKVKGIGVSEPQTEQAKKIEETRKATAKKLEVDENVRVDKEVESDKRGELDMYKLLNTTDYSKVPSMNSEYVLAILEDNSVVISGQSGNRTILPGETVTYGATDISVEQVNPERIKVMVNAHYSSTFSDKLEININGVDKDDPYVGTKFAADVTTVNMPDYSYLQMIPMVNESVALFDADQTDRDSYGIHNVRHDDEHKMFKTFVESIDSDDRLIDISYGG